MSNLCFLWEVFWGAEDTLNSEDTSECPVLSWDATPGLLLHVWTLLTPNVLTRQRGRLSAINTTLILQLYFLPPCFSSRVEICIHPRRQDYMNNQLRINLCNGRDLITMIYVMTPKVTPPNIFYVMADPINYTENFGFPSVIS